MMDNQISTATVASGRATMTTTDSITVLPTHLHRILQNFLLIWLDANFNESEEDFKKSIQHLRHIVASIRTFTDANECVNFLRKIKEEKAFIIVSGSLGQRIIPEIQALPQLDSVYVFCDDKSVHEQWAKTIPKIKGVYTDIKAICKALQADREDCDRAMISLSFNGIDPLFMYTQLLKEVLLEIKDDDTKSVKEFVDFCRCQEEDIDEEEIDQFEREYRSDKSIWWYTAETFIYPMLNRSLRLMEVDIILKMGFFIQQLHQDIENLHRDQQSTNTASIAVFEVFRGQRLSLEDFDKVKKTKGGLMSFNNFLSTSRNYNRALEWFARPAALRDPSSVGILFVMTIDRTLCAQSSIPFADVKNVGAFKDKEEEILFSTHTVFRIEDIKRIQDDQTDRLWKVNLTLIGNNNHDLNTLTVSIREELKLKAAQGLSRLGFILIKIGEFSKAEQLYQILLEKASSNKDQADYNLLLGSVKEDTVSKSIDGRDETDENECEYWPCNNTYTRCDGLWSCKDGADEVNCPSSTCPEFQHSCVFLNDTSTVSCLPIARAGDGIVDCLGEKPSLKLRHMSVYPPQLTTHETTSVILSSTHGKIQLARYFNVNLLNASIITE
ncbi:unnamed protein product [Rotaria sp. Silwood1]|nr:unnamed protein product [Rotaria sp. Silwood1]